MRERGGARVLCKLRVREVGRGQHAVITVRWVSANWVATTDQPFMDCCELPFKCTLKSQESKIINLINPHCRNGTRDHQLLVITLF